MAAAASTGEPPPRPSASLFFCCFSPPIFLAAFAGLKSSKAESAGVPPAPLPKPRRAAKAATSSVVNAPFDLPPAAATAGDGCLLPALLALRWAALGSAAAAPTSAAAGAICAGVSLSKILLKRDEDACSLSLSLSASSGESFFTRREIVSKNLCPGFFSLLLIFRLSLSLREKT